MNSKRWPNGFAFGCIFSIPLAMCLYPVERARAETFDVEVQAGQTEVQTRKFQEIDKRGYTIGASVFKYWMIPYGQLGFGLGASTLKVEGKKSSRGITQDLSLNLLSIDLRYLYAYNENLGFGPILRTQLGRGAKFSVQGNDDVDLLFSPGVMARYAFNQMDYQPAVSLSYSHDANIAKRDIQTILFGVSVTTDLPSSSTSAAAAPVPPSVSAVAPEPVVTSIEPAQAVDVKPAAEPVAPLPPAPETPAAIVIEKLTFNFNPNSSRLNGISRERAKALAKVLIENDDAWSKILITGHSDKSGDPALNIDLSKRRTEAFCDTLAKRGVPRTKMNCVPMDFQELLPNLPDNAENHRRIEVTFEDTDQSKAQKLKLDIQKNLQL
ncbi:MAG: OmpA family protein [Proteobacteria bacterium]|nr:MAG: OmpA family protein [Pseudomonadota bacterium]